MAKLRIRRGDKVLGSTDADGLAEWLESGLISEYDLVAVGEGEDWQLIRDFVDAGGVPAAAPDSEADLPVSSPPAEAAPAPEPEGDDGYRPIWDVEEEEPEEEEAAEIRIPDPPPDARPRRERSSAPIETPAAEVQESEVHETDDAGSLAEDEIDAAFRKLVRWEGEAPKVADPAAKSDPRVAARKSARRNDESGVERRGGKKKKRRRESPSDPEQPRRKQRRRQ